VCGRLRSHYPATLVFVAQWRRSMVRLPIKSPVRLHTIHAHGRFTSVAVVHRTPELSCDTTSQRKTNPRISRNRVRTAGIFGKHLLNVDTCYVVGTQLLCQYWPLVRFPPTFGQSDTSRTHQYLWSILAVAFPQLVCLRQLVTFSIVRHNQ
jgi:hypothetical protein